MADLPHRMALKAIADLEWSELLGEVARTCASEVGTRRIRGIVPASDLDEARARMALTEEALATLALAEPVPAQGAAELEEALAHVRLGGILEAEVLVAVRRTLESARRLRTYLTNTCESFPRLQDALTSDPTLDGIARDLKRCLDDQGEVLDAASPALRDARRTVNGMRGELSTRMRRLAKKHADVLREGGPVEREGRFALPVRADAHKRVDGIVLGASATGATLYVEPPEITAATNRLTLALAEVQREIQRVLAMLSDAVRESVDAIEQAHEACIRADVLSALSSWAQRCRGRTVLLDDEARLDLVDMRHPLLVAQDVDVVANHIRLECGQALVISGPNAGGKTVALKCAGLAVWMARSGIPIPVGEESTVGWYPNVLTDIGDAQSLERSLSTFSAEVVALGAILSSADAHTLVLLDEVAGGTDPEEGAALAGAVLEALVERGATTFVTTHYERLKEMAAETERFVNASVGFDFDAMQPTFRLNIGQPGASSALAVAQRFGLPLPILSRARELLSEEAVRREELIADLERQRNAIVAARESAERDAESAGALLAEAEKERQVARDKERKRLARETSDLIDKVKKARGRLRAVETKLKDSDGLREAQRDVDAAARLVAVNGALNKASRDPARVPPRQKPAAKIEVGTSVYVERLGTTAKVIEAPDRGHVRVQAGAFGIRVPLSEVRVDGRKRTKSAAVKSSKSKRKAPLPPTEARAMRTSDNTCDLRGCRVDEGLDKLDRFIDVCLRLAEPVAFALHGHGTGAMRSAVREYLALHGHVARSRAASMDEGGDAFTVFWIRD